MNEKKIFCNGVFDCLHSGHFQLIKAARHLAPNLIIAIDSDRRVKEMKGENRPFHKEWDRKSHLEMIKGVGFVFIFDTNEQLERIIKDFSPDYMIVGEEYKDKKVIGSQYAKEIIFFPKIDGFSTSKILEQWK